MMKFLHFLLILSLLGFYAFTSPAIAKEKIEFSGFGAAGIMFIDRHPLVEASQPTYYMGKLQAEIEFNDEIDAQLDLRGNSMTNNITLREFSVKFKYMDYMRFKMGNIKRPFGNEYMVNREDLLTIDRSVLQNNISLRGYSVRSVSVMAYYNYNEKRPDFPYTYAVSLFKDNSLGSGLGLRGMYHIDKISFGLSYLYQSISGNYPISAHGIGLEGNYINKNKSLNLGFVYVQDPLIGKEILATNEARLKEGLAPLEQDEIVYSTGVVLSGGWDFDTDARIIRSIEPVFLFSLFIPETQNPDNHVIQSVLGANFYFTRKVRLRLNADLRLTRSEYDESGKYATDESRGIIEVQVRF